MAGYNNIQILKIVEEYESSDNPESILAKYKLKLSDISSWQRSIKLETIPKDNICNIHYILLIEGEAKMHYGLVKLRKVYWKAKLEDFRYSTSFKFSEAIPIMPPTTKVEYCPKCRKAEEAWKAEFGSPFASPPDWENG